MKSSTSRAQDEIRLVLEMFRHIGCHFCTWNQGFVKATNSLLLRMGLSNSATLGQDFRSWLLPHLITIRQEFSKVLSFNKDRR